MIDAVTQSEAKTVDRFNRGQDRIIRDFGYGDTAGAMGIARANLKKLSEAIASKVSIENSRGLPSTSYQRQFAEVIRNLDPDVVALSVMNSALHGVGLGEVLIKTINRMGVNIAGECWANDLLMSDAKLGRRIEKAVKAKHGNLKYRRQAARSIAKRAGFRSQRWSTQELSRAGGWLLDVLLTTLPEVFELQYGGEDDNYAVLGVTPEALAVAEASVEIAVKAHPAFIPSTDTPRPWTGLHKGGFTDERARVSASFTRTHHRETEAEIRTAMRDGTAQPHVDAVNALQSVPFKINRRVLGLINMAYLKGLKVKGLPTKRDIALPERNKDWDRMTDNEKELWKHKVHRIKQHNRTLLGNRLMFKQDCEIAKMLADADAFYTPMNCDWRGRIYGITHFNFQRDDRVRALFLFAQGEPLGEDGLRWLKIHVANCGDFDKVSKRPLDERVAWVDENLERIIECTNQPLEPKSTLFWTAADKPFLFIAACMELAEAVKSPSPTSFITHLPVSLDGSCSGLQHLTAMTRAPEGSLVNLTPSETPQDVYQTVADLVKAEMEKDLEGPNSRLALLSLSYGITRKLVKRNVMTYSYSSKKFGMAQQQEEDLLEPLRLDVMAGKLSEHPFGEYAERPYRNSTSPAARYLAEKIYAAIQTVVNRPAKAMVFLQKIARALAHEGKPVRWTTPTGLPWTNRYHDPIVKRVRLWLHDKPVTLSIADGSQKKINKDKAANGIAPNFVHALDAAHLALTVNAARSDGITSVATVHDSFGCLANRAGSFSRIIRETFVSMYEQHDVLNEVLEQASRDITLPNSQRLPEGLEYGELNLHDVTEAQYAFA